MKYDETFKQSIEEPHVFWGNVAENVEWDKKWETVLDDSNPPHYRWFKGGKINTCYNCLDVHVERGNGERVAVVYDSPVTDTVKKFTYSQMLDLVSRFGGVLEGLGVKKGDTVIIYLPMIPEALIAMLACARIGAVHSVVFGGFAPKELAVRIDDAKPKVIVTASCGIEKNRIIPYQPLLKEAIELSTHRPEKCIMYQREQLIAELDEKMDLDWDKLMEAQSQYNVLSWTPMTHSTFSIPRAQQEFQRGWSETMAVMRLP